MSTMLKIILLLFAYISVNIGVLVNRTDTITWANIRTPDQFRGVKVTKVTNGYEILWEEKIDNRNNTLIVYFNYIFEDTGTREIINVNNLCGDYKVGSLEHDVQLLIMSQFVNSLECPIKKGTKAMYLVPKPYTYPTENHECGLVDGTINIFKKSLSRPKIQPLVLRVHFIGNVTGPECSN
ncbi:uncharacterized protein LOC122505582 [Leptopilina heterotoma]|uniref:uncharacterized protein LOC122505582 n=1 Tax=Leptopilina heterotoma TaxID=63436 RepID=UPI001CA90157|nr:uncharacterized protein LOC122505582 [Leptopilina heterotoma]